MSAKPAFTERRFVVVLTFVTLLFMLWGIAMTLGDTLNKHFQSVLHISRTRSAYVQASLFGAYFVVGIPAGLFMKRFGYKRGVLLGLGLYAVGAFLFIPASNAQSFNFFRVALFILACGLATLETVAHPFVAALGDQRTSDQRINFSQFFNGLGGIVAPLIGGYFILQRNQEHSNDLVMVKNLYFIIGVVISCVAVIFSFIKVPRLGDPHVVATDSYAIAPTEQPVPKRLFQQKHFVFAAIAQFFNVCAQGGTWAYFINYGHEVMGLTPDKASYYFSLSLTVMVIGRLLGTVLMRYIAPYKLLSIFATGNIVMCIIVAQHFGVVSFAALIMINFFFSIMFPTIFSLGLKDLGPSTEQASSFIVMGVVGGALFPFIMGWVADEYDVASAYYAPIICYVIIFLFGFRYPKLNRNTTLHPEK